MSNKTQLHLKTINFNQTLYPSSRFTTQSLPKPTRSSSRNHPHTTTFEKKEIKSHPNTKRHSTQMLTSASQGEFMGKFNELSINRQSLRLFSKKQLFKQSGGFPKREPVLRNTNAFKYFVNSAINKAPLADNDFLSEFKAKIKLAIKDNDLKEIIDNQTRKKSVTECSAEPYKPTRIQRSRHMHSAIGKKKQTAKEGLNAELQPWETFTGQNAIYLTDL